MPTSDHTRYDELISNLIAALDASRSLHMDAVEKLVRMSLIELGQSIARTQMQKPRKIKSPSRKTSAAVSRKLALVTDIAPDAPGATISRCNDIDMLQRRSAHPPVSRRRLPPRRTGSRG